MDTSRQSMFRVLIFITLFACILLYLAFQGNPLWEELVFLCLPGNESNPYDFRSCVEFFYSSEPSEEEQASGEPPTPTFTPSPTPTPTSEEPPGSDAPSATPSPTPNPDGVPEIINSICLNEKQLMIVFEFQQPVTGLYEVFVDGVQYQPSPVPDQPARLFVFGAAPPGGGMPEIVMRTLPDQIAVLDVADYPVPQCDFQSPNNNNPGGGGDYIPPP